MPQYFLEIKIPVEVEDDNKALDAAYELAQYMSSLLEAYKLPMVGPIGSGATRIGSRKPVQRSES